MKKKPIVREPDSQRQKVAPEWDWVDQAGWESFPASDPPAVDPGFDLKPVAVPTQQSGEDSSRG